MRGAPDGHIKAVDPMPKLIEWCRDERDSGAGRADERAGGRRYASAPRLCKAMDAGAKDNDNPQVQRKVRRTPKRLAPGNDMPRDIPCAAEKKERNANK